MSKKVTRDEWVRCWDLLQDHWQFPLQGEDVLTFSPSQVEVGNLAESQIITYAAVVDGVMWRLFGQDGRQGKLAGLPGVLTAWISQQMSAGMRVELTVELDTVVPIAMHGLPRIALINRVIKKSAFVQS